MSNMSNDEIKALAEAFGEDWFLSGKNPCY